MFTPSLPPIVLDSAVDPADRVSAIDFIHRVNWLFDAWDIDAMVEAFLPDSVTHHTHGVSRGKIETPRFFQEQCSLRCAWSQPASPQPRRRSRTMTTG